MKWKSCGSAVECSENGGGKPTFRTLSLLELSSSVNGFHAELTGLSVRLSGREVGQILRYHLCFKGHLSKHSRPNTAQRFDGDRCAWLLIVTSVDKTLDTEPGAVATGYYTQPASHNFACRKTSRMPLSVRSSRYRSWFCSNSPTLR